MVTVRGQLWASEGDGEQWQALGGGSERHSHGRSIERSIRRCARWLESRGNMAAILDPSFFLTSPPLSNQCICFLNHLNPAPFSLSHPHGCGPGHHHLSPRLLPGSGRSRTAQDLNPPFTLLSSLKGRGNLYSSCQSLYLCVKTLNTPCLLVTVQTPQLKT